MSFKPAPSNPPDAGSATEELLSELQALRARNAALEESEKRYRELVESANSIIIRWDMEGNLTFFNEFAEKLFGYSESEVLGRNVVGTIVPPSESTGRDLAAMVDDILKRPERYELNVNENIRNNGERVTIAWTNRAICDERGEAVEILSVGNDITERRRAEKDLMLTQFSIDRAADMALWVAPDARFIYANEAACKAFGYTREEFLSLKAFDTNPYFNDENWGEHWKEIKERGSFTLEARLRRKDGTYFPGEITVNYLVYEGKEYNCSYVRDITGRKQAEEALQEAKAQAELYVDLMGHDINNIHQAALGYLELARDMPVDKEEHLDMAMEALMRSTRLISNVRKLQEIPNARSVRDMDLCEVLGEVHGEYARSPGKTVTLSLNGSERCFVRADDLLRDVFSNLVGNAVKHTGKRASVLISLDEALDEGTKYYRVSVEDDGPGIRDELKKALFGRSLKGTPRAKGMGLGLYVVKSLVGNYGGLVRVEDRVEGDHAKGARFVVLLPMIK